MSSKNYTYIGVGMSLIAIIVVGIALYGTEPRSDSDVPDVVSQVDASGKQIIDITARGGYTPREVSVKANVPSILKFTTKNTFDCSSSISIPALKVTKNLPSTGVTSIEIPPQPAGTEINGTCAMGMYGFKIKFI